MTANPRPAPRGFTLVELLVVITIIGLISAVTIPAVLPALNERKVSEGARLLQGVLAGARDAAVRAGAPRGIRLLVDPDFNGRGGKPLASNRMIAIEPGPDYSEGRVRTPLAYPPPPAVPLPSQLYFGAVDKAYFQPGLPARTPVGASPATFLTVSTSGGIPGVEVNPMTGWSYNIRQGDRIRFNDSGNFYTIAGPIGNAGNPAANNPERFIICPTSTTTPFLTTGTVATWQPEYLFLTNGIDDDGDGWVDEACDGIDNDNDGIIDPGFDGIDNDGFNGIDNVEEQFWHVDRTTGVGGYDAVNNEYEKEVFVGIQATYPPTNDRYTISRRPVVSPGAREVGLPDGIVIDLTTWNAASATDLSTSAADQPPMLPERSRLPVDPYTLTVDIMISPNGQVVLPGAGGGGNFARSPIANSPFYHFWLTEREGVRAPLWDDPTKPGNPIVKNPNAALTTKLRFNYLLPMPKGTLAYRPDTANPNPPLYDASMPDGAYSGQTYKSNPVFLTGRRRLVTLFVRTGQISSTSIEEFYANDINTPYYAAQSGIKEAP